MDSYSIEVTGIPGELLKKLDEKVSKSGEDRASYIRRLIQKDVEGISLRDLFVPVREEMDEIGMTEGEFDALVDQAREQSYQAHKGKAK